MTRRAAAAAAALLLALAAPAAAQETKEVGHVNTAITNLGLTRSHRVVVERFEDPEVQGIACYISQARTGGFSGMLGIAEDPSRFALTCTATGPVTIAAGARRGERLWEGHRSHYYQRLHQLGAGHAGTLAAYAAAMVGTSATALACRLWAPTGGWWALAAWVAVVCMLFAAIDYHWRKKTNVPAHSSR